MAVKRVNWEVMKALQPLEYTTADGIEATHDQWIVEAVGPRDALAAHPLFGRLLLEGNKRICHRTGTKNSVKRDGRVRVAARPEYAAAVDERFQSFMAPLRVMAAVVDELR